MMVMENFECRSKGLLILVGLVCRRERSDCGERKGKEMYVV